MKIDYVIPYVDPNAFGWKEEYLKYNKIIQDEEEFLKRYQENILFKYVFRGIEKHMSWVNNIFLIVENEHHIPSWIDTRQVQIIYHSDFIPQKFLPTFNSNTIECFLHKIEKISNLFIYGNDDCYCFQDCFEHDFFDGYMPRNNVRTIKGECDQYSQKMININKIIYEKLKQLPPEDGYYNTAFHIQQPYSKVLYKKIFSEFEDVILNSISRTRNEKTISQFFFSLYFSELTDRKYINNDISWKYFNINLNFCNIIRFLKNPNRKLVCLNNGVLEYDKIIDDYMNNIFPDKSKYEL